MRRPKYDLQIPCSLESCKRLLVQLDDDIVASAHDQQRRCGNDVERFLGHIRTTATRDDSANNL